METFVVPATTHLRHGKVLRKLANIDTRSGTETRSTACGCR